MRALTSPLQGSDAGNSSLEFLATNTGRAVVSWTYRTCIDESIRCRWNILDGPDLGTRWAHVSAAAKLTEWMEDFATNHFPAINELIIRRMDELEQRSNVISHR